MLFYLLLPTRMFYWDGIAFSMEIEKAQGPGDPLFSRHHLLYAVAGNEVYRLLRWSGHPVRAIVVLQSMNAAIGAVSVVVLFLLLRRMGLSAAPSAALALVFAFSATWWKFSSDADPYIFSVLLLLLSYSVLRSAGQPRPISAGLLHAGAMLMHQLAVMFFPAALACLWLRPSVERKAKLRGAAVYLAAAAATTAAAYAGSYWLASPPFRFVEWCCGHASQVGFSFHLGSNLMYSLRGNMQLFFGGKARNAFSPDREQVAGLAMLAAAVATLVVKRREVGSWLRQLTPGFAQRLRGEIPLLTWVAAYAVFLFFWEPYNTFYRLFYLPPILLLAAAIMSEREPRSVPVLTMTVTLVWAWNFVFLIRPQSRVEANEPLRFALFAQRRWPPGTAIVFRDFPPDLWTISYFNMQASWVSSRCANPAEIDGYLRLVGPDLGGVWLTSDCHDALESALGGKEWLAATPGSCTRRRTRGPSARFVFSR